jgi:predicted small metal-binding protein
MDKKLKRVSCDPMCGFMIQSHDEKEIIEDVKMHAKKVHNMTTTDNDIKAKMVAV